jgi:hypothetical protein
VTRLSHKFVDFIPDALEAGVLYVSVAHGTAVHRCCCGCESEVVTPLTPTDWKIIYDGETVSLHPSIGNWNLSCRSHYWITHNRVEWAEDWSAGRVATAEAQDKMLRKRPNGGVGTKDPTKNPGGRNKAQWRFWSSLWNGW